MSSTAGDEDAVVICGGGIIAASIAYHLTQKGVKPIVLERSEVAAAASGKSGGFLARDWGSGPAVQLHTASFALHEKLAKELTVESFRKLPTLSVKVGGRKGKNAASWLDGKASSSLMDDGTAQVTPLELTHKLIDAAKAAGAEVRIGTVASVDTEESSGGSSSSARRVTGVTLASGETIPCAKAIVAMGPWSVLAEGWFGIPVPMEGVKSTSLIYEDVDAVRKEPFALFCSEDANGCHLEVYPRPNGEVYICGLGGSDYVDAARLRPGGDCEAPELIKADPRRVAAATKSFSSMTSIGATPPDVSQACMRPCPPDALPIMGAVPGVEGAYICAGHNCWGILWAPVSGVAMAELVVDGAAAVVDLAPFSPARFMTRASGGRGRKRGTAEVGEQW
ncbi:FAD dependent oxidoreductase [Tribonema minus]|uniref:FAD dependent oxidoreductase n=1 Tax=Tribonema minus TaxID=303371 RepID=A0A835ZIK8_9STRA|nr:FAD dependent oxidoreductase [Tribonema minus]